MTRPELIGEDFTYNEYTRRITRNDIGKRILYRGPMMTGWSVNLLSYVLIQGGRITCH